MNNTVVLLVVLIVVLIYFLQVPRKTKVIHRHPLEEILFMLIILIYLAHAYGWARPIRRKIRHVPMMPVIPAQHLLGPGNSSFLNKLLY